VGQFVQMVDWLDTTNELYQDLLPTKQLLFIKLSFFNAS
jgi:hypothetical protein